MTSESARLSALFIALTFENYEQYFSFYEILVLIKNKKIQMFFAFFNDTNNNFYYRINLFKSIIEIMKN